MTICVQKRECLFGEIVDGEMRLNDAGKMVKEIWTQIPGKYPNIDLDEYSIMPNHIHGIVIVGATPRGCPEIIGQAQGPAPTKILSLSVVVHRFKTLTTKRYIDGVRLHHWTMCNQRLWQRNYYEHIIRNDKEYWAINQYIRDNPINWEADMLNRT